MEKVSVIVDVKNMNSTKKTIDEECTNLLNMIKEYKQMFEDTIKIYDTESATLYRKLAVGYLEIMERYINKDFRNHINYLDKVQRLYNKELTNINSTINGGAK